MSVATDKMWSELGIIAAIYATAVIIYTLIMAYLYGNGGADLLELAKQIPGFLKPKKETSEKVEIVLLFAAVVINTLPLAISSAILGFNAKSGGLSTWSIVGCIVAPFFIYYLIADPSVIMARMEEVKNIHGIGQVMALVSMIVVHYVTTFKVQALGAVMIGGWGGYRLREATKQL